MGRATITSIAVCLVLVACAGDSGSAAASGELAASGPAPPHDTAAGLTNPSDSTQAGTAPAAPQGGDAASAPSAALATSTSEEKLVNDLGQEIFEQICSSCHDLSLATDARKTRRGWQLSVNRMYQFGLTATDEQAKLVVDYLAATYPEE